MEPTAQQIEAIGKATDQLQGAIKVVQATMGWSDREFASRARISMKAFHQLKIGWMRSKNFGSAMQLRDFIQSLRRKQISE